MGCAAARHRRLVMTPSARYAGHFGPTACAGVRISAVRRNLLHTRGQVVEASTGQSGNSTAGNDADSAHAPAPPLVVQLPPLSPPHGKTPPRMWQASCWRRTCLQPGRRVAVDTPCEQGRPRGNPCSPGGAGSGSSVGVTAAASPTASMKASASHTRADWWPRTAARELRVSQSVATTRHSRVAKCNSL